MLRQLHSRDLRCRFCPEGHWVSNRFTMNSAYDKPSNMHFLQYTRRSRLNYRPFRVIPVISMDNIGISIEFFIYYLLKIIQNLTLKYLVINLALKKMHFYFR